MLAGVAAVLFCLQLLYLAAANLVLRSQLIQNAVGASEGFALEFSSAYSLWPGHVHVEDVSLRIEDYNIQFEVALAAADVDIAISELPFKKFHATKLRGEGTRFRMRHKLIVVGEDAERVAAYPPIKGFADPPYFVGVPSPSTPPEDYDLWEVRIQDVVARVSELWVMEYRFQGQGVAAGSFVVQPERWVQVEPASLDLERGTFKLGEHLVAAKMSGRIVCDIPDMRVPETEGVQVLRDVLARVRLELRGGNLEFLQAYLARFGSARYSGAADWHVDLDLARGVLQPGSKVEIRALPLTVRHSFATLSADTMLSFGRPDEAPELSIALSAPRVNAERKQVDAPSPSAAGVAGSLKIRGADFKQELSLGAAQVAVQDVRAPSLAWFAEPGTQLSGSAQASFEAARGEDSSLTGSARLRLSAASFARQAFGASGDLHGELGFARSGSSEALELHKATVELTNALLRSGEDRSKPFAARLDASGLRVKPTGGANARGQLRLHVSSAEALLPLVMGSPLRGVTSTALDLEGLDARAAVQVSAGKLDVQVVDATSGNLRLKGYLSKRERQPRGAFMLSSGPLNVGVTLSDGETEVSPFVGDDWLASAWPRIARAKSPG
ncbi:MAG: hypothetical protein EOO73_07915 [Myxococcales bacterium]|nr:MAG: hypothetical protein EOO73_07915 [Myxococcales bacterium]